MLFINVKLVSRSAALSSRMIWESSPFYRLLLPEIAVEISSKIHNPVKKIYRL